MKKAVSLAILTLTAASLSGCWVSQKEFNTVKQERDDLAKAHQELREKVQKYDNIMLQQQVTPRIIMIETLLSDGNHKEAGAELTKLKDDFPSLIKNEIVERLDSRIARIIKIESEKPDFTMSASDFLDLVQDSNSVRAKQLYHDKRVRLSASIQSVTDSAVFLSVRSKSHLMASLSDESKKELKDILPLLEKGMDIMAEGRFNQEHEWISDSILLHPKTLVPLSSANVAALENTVKAAETANQTARADAERQWAEYSVPFQRTTWARLASGLTPSKPGDKFIIRGRITRLRGEDDELTIEIWDTNGDTSAKVPTMKRGVADWWANKLYESKDTADFYIEMMPSMYYNTNNWPEIVAIKPLM